ncbi:MAG TPA: transglutaminase domain-containing protein [Streptosporangiaceae bacterium]
MTLTTGAYLGESALNALRTQAQDLARAKDWPGLLALRTRLEHDRLFWTDLWGPMCALAGRLTGQPDAADLLADLVEAGFSQPELFGGELKAAFADDPRWPEISAALGSKTAPVPVALTDWPVVTPAAPLGLFELAGRAGELLSLVPPPLPSAWQTAQAMLAWVAGRWRHADAHMEIDDAVECLRRVDAGRRYACVEYSLVLSQALNALRIPARQVSLRQANYHTGVSRGHVVSEAWIDDLNRWVLLDGQNGLYWIGADGKPLGAVELQRLARTGAARPDFVTLGAEMSQPDADDWFSYFAHVTTSAGSWSPEPFGIVFQRVTMQLSQRLEHHPDALYPDLSELGVETALLDGQPAVRLVSGHPFARGFAADGTELDSDMLVLNCTPGEHEHALQARTDYGTLRSRMLRYVVA